MKSELVVITLAFDSALTWLIDQENFITFTQHEGIKSYIADKCSENVADFRYLGRILNLACIYKEIKYSLNTGNACCCHAI
jgi:hypothetical protein